MKKILYKFYNFIIDIPNLLFSIKFLLKPKNYFQKNGYQYLDNPNIRNLKVKLSKEINKINIHHLIENSILENPLAFKTDIEGIIDDKLYKECQDFFSSKDLTQLMSIKFGRSIQYRNLKIFLNFHNKNVGEEGSKKFHRDGDTLNDQLKIFIPITPLNNDNGMFSFISNDYIPSFYILKNNVIEKDPWNRNRFSVNEVMNKFRNLSIEEFDNENDCLLINTSSVYHKGGHVKNPNAYRVMVQVTYTPILSLSNWNKIHSKILMRVLFIIKNRLRIAI